MNDSDLRTAWNAPEPVNPADLRRYWDFTQKIQAQHPPTAAGAIGIDIRCIEAELPGTNVAAVWVRAGFLVPGGLEFFGDPVRRRSMAPPQTVGAPENSRPPG